MKETVRREWGMRGKVRGEWGMRKLEGVGNKRES